MAKVFIAIAFAIVILAVVVDAHHNYYGGGRYGAHSGGGSGGTSTNSTGSGSTNVVRSGAPCNNAGTWGKDADGKQCVCAQPQRAKRHSGGGRYGAHSHGNGGSSNNIRGLTWHCNGSGGNNNGSSGGGLIIIPSNGTGSTA